MVKRILHDCHVCKRHEGKSSCIPPPPPLPSFRLQEAPPFTNTGVDFTGPLYIKYPGGSQSKSWIVLYTCCVTQAIHLDLVCDMSAPTFIRSFKRFSSRRGLPALMISDNAKTFKAAAKVLKRVVASQPVQSYLEGLGIEWRFNIPKAPWWGGLFERLVRSTKRCLRKVLGQAKLSYDELQTTLVEVEVVLNSRPHTYISPEDLDEPLTPSHLLTGQQLMSLPDHLYTTFEADNEDETCLLNSRLKYLNRLLDGFWTRWRREYLLELREAHRYHHSSGQSQLSEGDVVVVFSSEQPRSFWKIGRIEQIIAGPDGQNRAATVRVSSKGRISTLNRPIQHLYPLEVRSPSTEPSNAEEPSSTESATEPSNPES